MLQHGALKLPDDFLAYMKRVPIARDFTLLLAYSFFPRIQAVLDTVPESDGNNVKKLLEIADAEIVRMRENAPHLFLAWLSSHKIDEESLPFVTRCFEHCVERLTKHIDEQVKKHFAEE